MKKAIIFPVVAITIGCVSPTPAPIWNPTSEAMESEYAPYLAQGTASLHGQAFMTQAGGGVVKAAGRIVTLDPTTTIGNEWWGKAGKSWVYRSMVPPSPGFMKARRTTVADADGKFSFSNLPAGRYFVRTEVTWEVGGYNPTQGGLVAQVVDIKDGQSAEVILNQFPQ